MMISAKKFNWKRISCIIIAFFILFSAVSLVVTKVIYDSIFSRYDDSVAVPDQLSQLVDSRSIHKVDSDGTELAGYFYPADDHAAAHGLIVLVPGFHAGGDSYLWQIQSLVDYGWAVFTFDVTGTFRSGGEDQVGFPQPLLDLKSVLKYVENCGNFGYNNIVLMGHSQGGYAVCCALAQEQDVAAVVCISGVNSAMEAVMHMSSDAIGPIAYGNYGYLWLYQRMLFGDTLQLQAAEAIDQSDVPVLLVHGTMDEQVPMDKCSVISHREEITSTQVEYLLCPAGHTDLLYDADGTANDALMESIQDFLLRSLAQTS